MKNNKLLLGIGLLLLTYGIFKPDLSQLIPFNKPVVSDVTTDIKKPSDDNLLNACSGVIQSLRSGPNSRHDDGKKLSSLYRDLASLIQLDGENSVVKSTLEIREANRLSGLLCRLDIGGKYPDLATSCNNVVISGLGDKDVVLDDATRQKAVEVFMALSWACLEGSK
jgi:hypothetical protein